MDGSGNAVAVWYQNDGTHYNIWSNRYVVGTGWGAAELIEAYDSDSAYKPDVVMDSAGNAIAVWSQTAGSDSDIWSNRYESLVIPEFSSTIVPVIGTATVVLVCLIERKRRNA
jgi:hypothetical protein